VNEADLENAIYAEIEKKKRRISETELQKKKPKLMEFYDQVEINGKSIT
jgi:hypothetical protein